MKDYQKEYLKYVKRELGDALNTREKLGIKSWSDLGDLFTLINNKIDYDAFEKAYNLDPNINPRNLNGVLKFIYMLESKSSYFAKACDNLNKIAIKNYEYNFYNSEKEYYDALLQECKEIKRDILPIINDCPEKDLKDLDIDFMWATWRPDDCSLQTLEKKIFKSGHSDASLKDKENYKKAINNFSKISSKYVTLIKVDSKIYNVIDQLILDCPGLNIRRPKVKVSNGLFKIREGGVALVDAIEAFFESICNANSKDNKIIWDWCDGVYDKED